MKIRLSDWVRLERDGREQLFLRVQLECEKEEWDRGLLRESGYAANALKACFEALPKTEEEAGDDGLWLAPSEAASLDGVEVVGFHTSDMYRVQRTFLELLTIVTSAIQFKSGDFQVRVADGKYRYQEDIPIGA